MPERRLARGLESGEGWGSGWIEAQRVRQMAFWLASPAGLIERVAG